LLDSTGRPDDAGACHRFHLICRHLRLLGLDIRYILPSGEVEMQPATERRLLQRARTFELPLFQDLMEPGSEQVLARAYDEWWYNY
jgi:hypothetical protein